MPSMKEALGAIIPGMQAEIKDLVKNHGDHVVSEVTIKQVYGGMRGVKGLVCDTSMVDPIDGLIIRGVPLADLTDRYAEEIFYMLCTGSLPEGDDVELLRADFAQRAQIPEFVGDVLRALPKTAHPMAMFITAITALEEQSEFRKRYDEGMTRDTMWEAALEDGLNLLAKLPALAAAVYRIKYDKGDLIPADESLNFGANFAHMLGNDDPDFYDLMRLYMVLHCDHEGGNVSAFAAHVVGSALSDPYYAVAGGLSGLAGPLHGLANQECLGFIQGIVNKYGGAPTEEQMKEYAWEVLNSGRVVPGYGHAVLRATDPRFTAFHEFGEAHFPNDPVFQTVSTAFKVIPDILIEHGKAANPYPNVDAGSGALLNYYGITEKEFYTVFFSVSRAMGLISQLILSRAWWEPITRPKSHTTEWYKNKVGM
jgi:citrate synthase